MSSQFLVDEDGATAIEYALLAALLAVAIITGLTIVGTTLNTKFNSVATEVQNATPGGS
jgi:pilus assembly protein Flp/PilA